MPTRWRILAVLFLARLTMAIQFQAVAALSPVVMRAFDAGLSDIGLPLGLYLAPGVVISYPGGAIGARFGDRNAVAAGLVLIIAGGALTTLGATCRSTGRPAWAGRQPPPAGPLPASGNPPPRPA
jgi:MFS family permease